jgi:MFS family permease
LYVVGVLAASQLGKMSALVPLIERELALGLTVAALLVSLLEIGGASLGGVAGALLHRLGERRSLLLGLACFVLAGVGTGLAQNVPTLVAWRIVEAAGYLAVVIAAPPLISRTAGPARRGVALALWSSFVPVGLALGAMLAGTAAEAFSWRVASYGSGAVAAIALLASLLLLGPIDIDHAAIAARARPNKRTWQLAVGFGAYTLFEVGLLALLPSFLVEQTGASPSLAGLGTGIASLATLAGALVAAWHNHRPRDAARMLATSLLVPAVLLFAVFREHPDFVQVVLAAIVLNAVSGILPGLAFALLPRVAGDNMAIANGLFTQFGAGGSLLGPPVMAACVGQVGWIGASICGAVFSVLSLLLLLRAASNSAQGG